MYSLSSRGTSSQPVSSSMAGWLDLPLELRYKVYVYAGLLSRLADKDHLRKSWKHTFHSLETQYFLINRAGLTSATDFMAVRRKKTEMAYALKRLRELQSDKKRIRRKLRAFDFHSWTQGEILKRQAEAMVHLARSGPAARVMVFTRPVYGACTYS